MGLGGGLGLALAEEGDLLPAVGADQVAHVLHHAHDGNVHHLGHLHRLLYHHAHQLLGGGHDDDAVQGQGLEDAEGHVAGARGHVHEEVVHIPHHVGPELGDHAADDGAPPQHRVRLVVQQQVDAHQLDAAGGGHREHSPVVGHGPLVDAEGLGDGGAGDVRVQDADLVALPGHEHRQLAGDHALADAPLAGDHPEDLPHPGGGVVLLQEGLGLGAVGAALAAGAAVVGAFRHCQNISFITIRYAGYTGPGLRPGPRLLFEKSKTKTFVREAYASLRA